VPALFLPQRWRRQPTGLSVELDLAHPLLRGGPRFYSYGFSTRNSVNGDFGTNSGVFPGYVGRTTTISITNNSTNYLSWASSSFYDLPGPYTAFIRLIRHAVGSSNYDRVWHRDIKTTPPNGAYGFLITANADGNPNGLYWSQYQGGTSNATYPPTWGAVSITEFETHVVVNTGAALKQYRNGIEVYSGAVSSLYPTTGQSLTLRFGAISDGSFAAGAPCSVEFVGVTLGAWGESAVRQFTSAPYDILRPQRRILYFDAAAGGGDTPITVNAGSVTVTGYAPTLLATAHQYVTPPVGSATFTGYAPTILNGASFNITPSVGALSFTGYAPTAFVTDPHPITVPVGSAAFTGYTPTVNVAGNTSIAPAVGSMTFTGYAPALLVTLNHSITVPVGSFAFTGYAPSVVSPLEYTPGVGALALTGYSPTVVNTGDSIWRDVTAASSIWTDVTPGSTSWTSV